MLSCFCFASCKQVPDLTLNDLQKLPLTQLDGEALQWDKYQDKVLFVHFWASWCKDCIKEMPSLIKAYQALTEGEKAQIAMLFISDEEPARVEAYLERRPLPFEVYVSGKPFADMGVDYIPQTHIFPKGKTKPDVQLKSHHWNEGDLRKYLDKQ